MKGKGESAFGSVSGRRSGVVRRRAREGVALLVSPEVCDGMEGGFIKTDVGESEIWARVVGICECIWPW